MASTDRIILASESPRRAELLAGMGYRYVVVPPNVEESVPDVASPRKAAMSFARAKAHEVARRVGPGVILAADTVVDLDGELLGKPRDRAEAVAMLRRLSGTRHRVLTAFCIVDTRGPRPDEVCDVVATTVIMRPMADAEIREYVASGEADGKAGAYAIQETGDRYVESIEGSFTNVVGLPTERVAEALERFGVRPWR